MSAVDLEDIPTNTSSNQHLDDVVRAVRNRRSFLKSGLGLGAVGFLGGALPGCGAEAGSVDAASQARLAAAPIALRMPKMGFKPVLANSLDAVTVPEGYRHAVFCRWGDPLFPSSPAWKGDASEDAGAQRLQFGDNHDGMHFFPLVADSSSEGLLVMNHEYLNQEYFYTPDINSGALPWSADHVLKGQHAHGVSIAHVRLEGGNWKVVTNSPFNQRIHGNSPMLIIGPAAGHPMMRTSADASGTSSLGTLNNCGDGYTLWNTYLTCEENFNGYFGTGSGTDLRTASMKRYGIPAAGSSYRWEEHDDRFDYVKEPNEANRFGWIVEIDPFDPLAAPIKRTALGRFKHENAAMTLATDGRVVVYMGDDQSDDYLYKFVATGIYREDLPGLNRNLLDSGTLHVAKFGAGAVEGDMMGTGEWVPLKLDTPTTAGGTLGELFPDMGALLMIPALLRTRLAPPGWTGRNG